MRATLLVLSITVAGPTATALEAAAAGCSYHGDDPANQLSTADTPSPVLVYGFGSMAPSGWIGASTRTSDNYIQFRGSASNIQPEARVAGAGAYGSTGRYDNPSPAAGSC